PPFISLSLFFSFHPLPSLHLSAVLILFFCSQHYILTTHTQTHWEQPPAHTHTQTRLDSYRNTETHSPTHTYTHAHMHTCTYTHTHTHTHTHSHIADVSLSG